MRPQGTATGSFHGVMAATTPRGSCTIRSVLAHAPCSDFPRCSGPSSAYCRSVPTPASTPPFASPRGLPISRVVISASASVAASTRVAAAASSEPRSAGEVRAQEAQALRAVPTACSTSAGPRDGELSDQCPVGRVEDAQSIGHERDLSAARLVKRVSRWSLAT